MKSNITYWVIVCSLFLVGCKESSFQPPLEEKHDVVLGADSVSYAPDSAIGFLSIYSSPDDLIAYGDDDEASAWLWFHATYPHSPFVSFNTIQSIQNISQYNVLFWLRDVESGHVEDVITMPADVMAAQTILTQWYQQGGNLMLWGHAVLLTEVVGRLPVGSYTDSSHEWVCGCDSGRLDMGTWFLATQLNLADMFKKDHSTHPLFDGIAIYSDNNIRGIRVKGPGWTEDHNCVFFNYPAQLTGRQWQTEICYNLLTSYYGIYPLAVWDSQTAWVSQLNIYELRQGNTNNLGTIICIGNGGCEFSMKSYYQVGQDATGEPIWETKNDISAYPTNNCYQGNILRMAQNGIEYLRKL